MMKVKGLAWILLAVTAGFFGGVLGSQRPIKAAAPVVVRASKFELLNATGVAVATWEGDSGNSAHLRFLPSHGHPAIDVGVLTDGRPMIQMAGRDGKTRIVLELDQLDRPILGMGDDRWEGRVHLGFKGSDVLDREEDDWGLSFMGFGSERPVAAIGMVKSKTGTEGLLTVSGKRIR